MSLLALLQIASLTVFASLLAIAAWQDLRTLRIADALSFGIIATWIVWASSACAAGNLALSSIGHALAGSLVLFGTGAVGFAASALGGGDVKLLAATSLFAGPALTMDFLLVTSAVGAALGLANLAGISIGSAGPVAEATVRARLRRSLPYGSAIAVGGLWVAALLARQ